MAAPPVEEPNRRRTRKRGDGEGSVSQHHTGVWRARIMVGRLPDGKPDVRELYGKTRGEVQRRLEELKRQVQQGTVVQRHKLTVADLLEQWLDDCVTRGLRPKTLASYRQVVRSYLAPALGRHKPAELRPDHVRRICADLIRRGISATTTRSFRTVLHAALRLAVRMELLGRNVADAVQPPQRSRPELHPPGPAEVAKLLDAARARGDRWLALWTLAAYSGCRPGEMLALHWEDVNWEAGAVAIRRNLTKVNGAPPVIAEPKTPRGRRTVALPPEAMEALREHRQRQLEERLALGPDYADQGLVFATAAGRPHDPRNVLTAFKRALAAAGLPRSVRLYDLRHAHATLLFAAREHPKVVSERLGHSSISLTLDTYTHAVPGLDNEAAAKAQRLIRGEAAAAN